MDLILPDKPNVKADLWPHPLTAEQRYTTTVYAAPDTPLVRLLGDLLPGVPPADLVVMLNGRLVAPGEMALVRVQPDDVLTVRARLQGGDTNPINIILTIAVLALSFYVPGALGLTGFSAGLLSAGITIVGGLIVNALFPVEPPDAPDDGQKPGQQYSISGGANRPRPYEPVLMTLGEHRVFPDLAAVEYVEFIGGEQYLNQVFDFGVGNLDISDLRIGDTPLGSFTRKAAPSTHTVPHNVQGFGTIYTQWTGYTGANALAAVEQQLALPGEPITLVAGDVDTLAGVPLEDTSPVERTGSERAYQLGFDFVARLVRYNKKGKPRSQSVTVKIEYRIADSSDSWTAKNVTLTGSSAEPVRHTETIEVDTDPSPQQWEVRVSRTTAPSSDTRTVDDVAWTALRTYQVADADATGRTRLALRIRASGQLNSRIARLSGLVRNLAPTWDGSAWSDPAPSSNPAEILRWFARGVYAEGRLVGGLGLADARIDHAALEAWRTWCDTNGLTCNLVIDRGMSVVEVMTVIARCGRASLTWQTGKLGVVYNQENRPHSAMVTPANVIAGSFAVDYPDGRLADEIVTRYVDPAFDWQYAELRRLGNGVTAPTRTATVTLQGVTSRDQAKEETNLIAARQLYHKRRLSWEMGPEGQTLPRGDVANVSHDLISGGVTGRLIGGTKSAPALSAEITISEDKDYLEFRLADGTLHLTEAQHPDGAGSTGETDTPTLLTPLPGAPDNGGLAAKADPGVQAEDVLWRFYSGDKTPNRVKIIEVVPQSTERFRFVGIDDVPEYYAAKDLALTDPLPVNRYRFPAVVDMQVSENPIEVGGGFAAEIVVTLTVAGDWRGGVIQAQLNDEAVRTVAALSGGETRASWIEQPSGTLTITAVPGSEVAPTGPALTVTYEIGGDNLAPEEPLNLGASGLPGAYVVHWDAPTEPDYAATEIRDSAPDETDADNATPRAEVTGTQFTRLGLTGTDELKVWVRHRDHSGNKSDFETVTVTPEAPIEGADGVDGGEYEYVFCARATAAAITGSANLPDPDWHFDIPGLATANGVTRGQNKYYDGTPANLGADRPYVVRFKRRVQGFPAANADIGTVAWEQEPAYRQWGRSALPGAGRILVYDDQESGSLTAAGQYKFSNAAAFSGNSVITPANVKAAAYLYVHKQDAAGTDQSHYYDGVQAGDVVVWFDDNDFWLGWFITAKQKTGDVYRFALTFMDAIEEDAHNLVDGNVDLRFSTALDGVDGGGLEYVYCATALGGTISGSANLPDPDWHFDIPGLATAKGVTRGQNKYFDGVPKDVSATKPFVHPFKRRVQGFPAKDANIGTVAWEQEKAYKYWSEDGEDGVGISSVSATNTGVKITTTDGTSTDVPIKQVMDVSRDVDTGVVTVTYSDGSSDTFTVNDGEAGGSANLGALLIQRIYRLTSTPLRPNTARSTSAQRMRDNYIPTGATAAYNAPDTTNPYAWVAYRYGVSGSWTHWTDWQANGFHASILASQTRSAETYPPVENTAGAWSNQIANKTTKGNNVITDMVTQYRDPDPDNDIAGWTETRYWDGTAWLVVDVKLSGNYFFDGAIGARKLDVENLSALNIKVVDADIEGTLSASKLVTNELIADVLNVDTLWSGNRSVSLTTGIVNRTDTEAITLENAINRTKHSSILIIGQPDVFGVLPAAGTKTLRQETRAEIRATINALGTVVTLEARQTGSFGDSASAISFTALSILGIKDNPEVVSVSAPGAPGSVSATVGDYSSGTEQNDIRVTYTAPSDWGSGAANTREFEVRLFDDDDSQVGSTRTNNASTLTEDFTGLANGTYYAQVRSKTEDGESAWQGTSNVTVNVQAATYVLTLSPSSADIPEGDSQVFTATLSPAAPGNVTVSWALSGSGAGTDISFLSNGLLTSENTTISSGNTETTNRIYARDQDSTDAATLTVTATVAGQNLTDTSALDVGDTAPVYEATITAETPAGSGGGTDGYSETLDSSASERYANSSYGSISVSNSDSRIEIDALIQFENANHTRLYMPRGTSNSGATFSYMEIEEGGTTSRFNRTSATFSTGSGPGVFNKSLWEWDHSGSADWPATGARLTVRFYR